jgi:hypothetical protein
MGIAMSSPTQSAWPETPAPHSPSSGAPGQPPGRRVPKVLKILLVTVVTLVVLCAGLAGITAIVLYGDYSVQYPARFGAPARIGSLVHTTNPALLQGERDVAAQLRKSGMKQPFAAFYEDQSDPRHGVFVAGSTQRVLLPRFEVAGAFHTIQGDGIKIDDMRRVDAGKVGGTVQCGTAADANSDSVICAWADHGSVGVIRLGNRSLKEAADVVREIRGAAIIRD